MSCAGADELEPPWAAYPWIPLGSIGWRMGSGEGYLMEWSSFARQACPTADAAIEYLQRHPSAPHTWRSWIARWLARVGADEEVEEEGKDDDEDETTAWEGRVDEEGLVAEDAAYPVFVRNALRGDGMTVPWESVRETPYHALRYSPRELGWWARWLATVDRAAYLDTQPPPSEAWAAIERSARTGVAAVPYETGGIEAIVCTLVATGTLPPAWTAGHEPRGSIVFDETADDRDYWLWWVTDTFEDAPSWRRYLAAWPPAPESWDKAFAEHYLEFR